MYLLDLFEGMRETRHCNLVCGAPLEDRVNAGLC